MGTPHEHCRGYSGADPGFEKGGAQVARGRVFGHI